MEHAHGMVALIAHCLRTQIQVAHHLAVTTVSDLHPASDQAVTTVSDLHPASDQAVTTVSDLHPASDQAAVLLGLAKFLNKKPPQQHAEVSYSSQ